MNKSPYNVKTLGGTEQPASSGRCDVVRAGSGTVLLDVGCCIDTGVPENGARELNYTRRLIVESGDDDSFVVVADVLTDLVNAVERGTGVPTNAGDQSFDGGKPLAESTPKDKKKRCVKWSGMEREWLYECYLSGYRPGHRTGYIQSTFDLYKVRMGNDGHP